jgi:hypothetical protein
MKQTDIETIKSTFPERVSIFSGLQDGQAIDYRLWRWVAAILNPSTDKQLNARECVEGIRAGNISLKAKLPAIMPAGLLDAGVKLSADSLQSNILAFSNWLPIEVIGCDIPGTKVTELRNAIAASPNVGFSCLSAKAETVIALVRISDAASYYSHFEALRQSLNDKGIYINYAAGNPTAVMPYTYDAYAIINPECEPFNQHKQIKEPASISNKKLSDLYARLQSGDNRLYERLIRDAIKEINEGAEV